MGSELRVPVCYSFGLRKGGTLYNAVTWGDGLKQGECSRYHGFSATTFSLEMILGKCHAFWLKGMDAVVAAPNVE